MKKTVDDFLELDVEIKKLEKKKAALRAKILASRSVGVFVPGSNGVGVIITAAERNTFDTKAFKNELPELAARFSKTSTVVSLRISDNHLKVAA